MPAADNLLDRDELVRLPGESEADWYARVGKAVAASSSGPFTLLADRKHPLVLAEKRRTRGKRLLVLLVLAGTPYFFIMALALLWGAGYITQRAPSQGDLREVLTVVCALVGLWPAAMILGGAALAAEAVAEERKRDTAWQLVLSPLPARTLAAAKILPYFGVCAWALVALLPLYVTAYSSRIYLHVGYLPGLEALWPLRMPATLPVPVRTLVYVSPWSFQALGGGLLMCISDVMLTWIACHWGAAWAVRHRGTIWGAGLATGRVCGVMLIVGLVLFGLEKGLQAVVDVLASPTEALLLSSLLIVIVVAGGGRFLAKRATRAALRWFRQFHRLVEGPRR